ncbi:MAG: DbpA RNA binding domain-containing protein [Gemmatimonadales bacterium]
MSWEFAPSPDAATRGALASGKTIVVVVPPAGWMLAPLFDLLPADEAGLRLVILVPDIAEARELAATLGWIAPLRPLHACTGLSRTARLLRAGQVGTLVVTPADALRLAELSALKLTDLRRIAVIRPESIARLGDAETLAAILGEARDAQRILCPSVPDACTEFLTRYAHRAPQWVAVPSMAVAGEVHAVLCDERQRPALVRELLDQHNPASAMLWEALPSRVGRWMDLARDPALTVGAEPPAGPLDLVILPDLPTPALVAAAVERSGRVIVMIRPDQLPALQRMAGTVRTQRVANETDRARDRAAQWRGRLRDRLEAGDLEAELLTLGPLFDVWDPAMVAAAASALAVADVPTAQSATISWVKLRLDVGKKEGARPADVVGALLHGVGLAKDHVGRVDLRDGFCVVEVRTEDADAALRGLTGISIRGRRVTARLDQR